MNGTPSANSWRAYARFILRLPYRDLTGGYKCFRYEVLLGVVAQDEPEAARTAAEAPQNAPSGAFCGAAAL
ncbi:MAG: hypothetical protein Greene041679_5 [Parcubacteria group bacterium Greene0416_79]|nr:MAG: hypothetical protein Greene041679_5 [Parcubacteria group bacterium Greene0416_79]